MSSVSTCTKDKSPLSWDIMEPARQLLCLSSQVNWEWVELGGGRWEEVRGGRWEVGGGGGERWWEVGGEWWEVG